MSRLELLKLIGTGVYGSDIPDDDDTMEALTECIEEGLVRCDVTKKHDFFWLTKAGQRTLQ